mgnify:CR=1 FL=1
MLDISQLNLRNRKVLVVGGTRGIGLSIAKAYHQLGAEVVIWGRSESGEEVAESLSTEEAKVNFVLVDLIKTDSLDKCIEITSDYLGGKIDVLVNSAGAQFRCAALDYPEEKWREIVEINLNAVFFVSQKVAKLMCQQRKGVIINIASMCSFFGSVLIPAYSASKGGVAQLTKALSNEWAPKGIRVNAIAPGYIETELTKDIRTNNPSLYHEITSRIPMGRWGKVEDIQGLAVFLASDLSEYISGAVIPVDGGYLGK